MTIVFLTDLNQMKKIALLDIDMTIVDNITSEFNINLIKFLQEQQINEVYLVTGRNISDLWQHILQKGKIKNNDWKQQLLPNVVLKLQKESLAVMAVSTPYDHYLCQEPGKSIFNVEKSGDAARLFYLSFEAEIGLHEYSEIDAELLCSVFDELTGGNCYAEMPDSSPNQLLRNALGMYLAITDDTEKKGQLNFLLNQIENTASEEVELFFFDDKPENIRSAEQIFNSAKQQSRSHISSYHTFLVDKVKDFVPEQSQVDDMNSHSTPSIMTYY